MGRISAQDLWGLWSFEKCRQVFEGGSDTVGPQSAEGHILYADDGTMSVEVIFPGGLKAAYSCPYEVDEEAGTVTHILGRGVDLLGTMGGVEQTTRRVTLTEGGARLKLETIGPILLGGRMQSVKLWASLKEKFTS